MVGSFAGTSAEYDAKYRRGSPDAILDAVTGHLGLGAEDTVIDLGCGTGVLTVPMVRRVRLVVGIDPEVAMLAIARRDADPAVAGKVAWPLGADHDLPVVAHLVPEHSVGAVTIGGALHVMTTSWCSLAPGSCFGPGVASRSSPTAPPSGSKTATGPGLCAGPSTAGST